VLARLAVSLDEPVGNFAELLRVLRLTAANADDGRIFEWPDSARLHVRLCCCCGLNRHEQLSQQLDLANWSRR
jgi:hypothetical protein